MGELKITFFHTHAFGQAFDEAFLLCKYKAQQLQPTLILKKLCTFFWQSGHVCEKKISLWKL